MLEKKGAVLEKKGSSAEELCKGKKREEKISSELEIVLGLFVRKMGNTGSTEHVGFESLCLFTKDRFNHF